MSQLISLLMMHHNPSFNYENITLYVQLLRFLFFYKIRLNTKLKSLLVLPIDTPAPWWY